MTRVVSANAGIVACSNTAPEASIEIICFLSVIIYFTSLHCIFPSSNGRKIALLHPSSALERVRPRPPVGETGQKTEASRSDPSVSLRTSLHLNIRKRSLRLRSAFVLLAYFDGSLGRFYEKGRRAIYL